MFLLDTDVLSALRKKQRPAPLNNWLMRTRPSDMFLSVVTIGEIERGVEAKKRVDPAFAASLAAWLDGVLIDFDQRLLPFDLRSARRWGRLSATIGNSTPDIQIAATALEHGLTVVTRNVAHFRPTGAATVDPIHHAT
jgi:hypothetical protein